MRRILSALGLLLVAAAPAFSQGVLERSPNMQGTWGLDPWTATFVLAHRFEVFAGGDELTSIPTLTLGLGLPLGFTAGVDYTSFSETIDGKLAANENQLWLKRPFAAGPLAAAGLVAYNGAAQSLDGAVDLGIGFGRVRAFAEGRAFGDMFGRGDGGAAGAIGGALQLTQFIALTADVGKVLTEDSIPAAWSAALAMEIPASPHTLALQVTNTGATTLQGASRKKTFGSQDVRYGFSFSVVMGGSGRWSRLFDPVRPAPVERGPQAGLTRAEIRNFAFAPGEIRIRAGESVEWTNQDTAGHTVEGSNGQWRSGLLARGESYRMTFGQPGTYDYTCGPHPRMTGRIVVTP